MLYSDSGRPYFLLDSRMKVIWANEDALKRFPSLRVPSGFYECIEASELKNILNSLDENKAYFDKLSKEPFNQFCLYFKPFVSDGELIGTLVIPHSALLNSGMDVNPNGYIGNFTNEYKMPLTIMFSTLGLMVRHTEDFQDDVMKSYIKMVTQNCYRLLRLSNNIGEYSQYAVGGVELNLKNGDICKFVSGLCGAASVLTSAIGIPLDFTVPDQPIIMEFDPVRLAEAIYNLLSNSCKFTREGNSIRVRLEKHQERVVITVNDKGLGMSNEVLENIFKPYFSFNESNSGYGSTGLGLTLFKYIILQHNGTIAARSAPDEGTMIAFSLPIVTDGACEDYLAENSADYLSDRFSVLYVQLADVCGCPMP